MQSRKPWAGLILELDALQEPTGILGWAGTRCAELFTKVQPRAAEKLKQRDEESSLQIRPKWIYTP